MQADEGTVPIQTGPSDPDVPDAISIRLQSLLEDRFQLKLHRETRDLPIYTLSIAKGGSKIKSVEPPPSRLPGQRPTNGRPLPGGIGVAPGNLVGSAITMTQFVAALSGLLRRNIIDATDFKGYFDVTLSFAPESAPGNPLGPGGPTTPREATTDVQAPSIVTAIQEQLGLRLESARGPVEVLVIDSVSKPSEN